jgi:hypothetical protein
MAHAQQFHTAFVDGEVLVFAKEELDLAYKDKRCASCSSVLSLSHLCTASAHVPPLVTDS